MIQKNIGRLKLKLYNGIEELPAENYHKFNLYSLLDSGIGSDVEGIKRHMENIYSALQKKDYERLKTLFENYYLSLNYISEGFDLQSMAFCYLIHSVNGKELTDLSDENIHKLSKKISRHAKRQHIVEQFIAVKKKLTRKSKYISRIELARQKQSAIMADLKELLNLN